MYPRQKKRLIIRILRSQNNLSILCGKPPVEPTLDHIIPVSKGGTDHSDNLQVACQSCNSERGNDDLAFVPRRKRPKNWKGPSPYVIRKKD